MQDRPTSIEVTKPVLIGSIENMILALGMPLDKQLEMNARKKKF
jgi:hypothetical protein